MSVLVRDCLQHTSVERGPSVDTLAAYGRDPRCYGSSLGSRGIQDVAGITRHDVSAFAQAVVSGEDGLSPLSPRSAARTVGAVRALRRFWTLEGPAVVRLAGKGTKERLVQVGSYADRAVGSYLVQGRPALAAKGKGSPALFLDMQGGRISRQSAWGILRAATERAGVQRDVSPRTLRRPSATHLLEGGADVRVVQELSDHASVTTTQVYPRVTADTLREVYAAAHPRARA